MSVQSVALASLAVTYSDSEGEDVNDETKVLSSYAAVSHNYKSGQPSVISPIFAKSATNSPINCTNENNIHCNYLDDKIIANNSIKQGLVSYLDDSIVQNDGEVTVINDNYNSKYDITLEKDELITDNLIPPEPLGNCSRQLQDKISSLYKKIDDGLDLNNVIKQRKDFKNPSIYEKLIQFCCINELGTNYSPEIFDPFKWGEESNYLELGKEQVAVMEKLAKKTKSKNHGVTSSVKRTTSSVTAETIEEKRKIGKWDQVTTGTTSTSTTTVTKSASITSDKKCKVVIAFGAVQKKGGKIF